MLILSITWSRCLNIRKDCRKIKGLVPFFIKDVVSLLNVGCLLKKIS